MAEIKSLADLLAAHERGEFKGEVGVGGGVIEATEGGAVVWNEWMGYAVAEYLRGHGIRIEGDKAAGDGGGE